MEILFGYLTIALTLPFIWFMPKKLSRKEIYATWGWMAALTLFTDLTFGFILDLYDFDGSKITFEDLVLQVILPPSFGVIFLNFMPNEKRRIVFYIIGVTILSMIYELLAVYAGYLVYKGWTLWYSAPFYFFGMLLLRYHLLFLRR